jgi:hypothetical protein
MRMSITANATGGNDVISSVLAQANIAMARARRQTTGKGDIQSNHEKP